MVIPFRNYKNYLRVKDCDDCPIQSFRLIDKSGKTIISSPDEVRLNSITRDLEIPTHVGLSIDFFVEAFYDESNQPLCKDIISSVKIPVSIEICGQELLEERKKGYPLLLNFMEKVNKTLVLTRQDLED